MVSEQRIIVQRLHSVEAFSDGGGLIEGLPQPSPHQTAPHGRQRPVQHPQQGAAHLPLVQRLGDLEVSQRRLVQRHVPVDIVDLHAQDVAQALLLRLHDIGEQRAERRYGQGLFLEPEPRQG